MTDHKNEGAILADIVEDAAALILPLWRSGLEARAKADESPVTIADEQAEVLILERLASAFPGVPIISEEHASQFGTPHAIGARFLLVDPIDGTKAFIRGDAHFTVNIGLIEDGVPVAGAVNAPALGVTWYTASTGALRREGSAAPVPVKARPWPAGEAVALVSHTAKPERIEALKAEYGFAQSRPVDSSIKLCFLAEGQADVYPRHGTTMEWDIAAGDAVLRAAGGTVDAYEGGPFPYGKAHAGFRNEWFVARGGAGAPVRKET